MNFLTDPLTSRTRFRFQGFINVSVIVVGFTILAILFNFIASRIYPGLLGLVVADVVSLVIAWFTFEYLKSQPIKIRCPKCKNTILSSTQWRCRSCRQKNTDVSEHSFLQSCSACGDIPKAYKCHHATGNGCCSEMIFLTEDKSAINYASCLNSPNEDCEERDLQDSNKNVKRKQDLIVLAELDLKLKHINTQLQNTEEKTQAEIWAQECQSYYDGSMAVKDWVRRMSEEAAIKYKDHPKLLEDALAAIKKAAVHWS